MEGAVVVEVEGAGGREGGWARGIEFLVRVVWGLRGR